MPIYKFKCNKCNKEFEELLNVSDKDTVKCKCGGDTSIVITPASFIFKTTGFYTTDYKLKKSKNEEI